MASLPARFKGPALCKLCGARGAVAAETTIAKGVARVAWRCRACRGQWPLSRNELMLRRAGRPAQDR